MRSTCKGCKRLRLSWLSSCCFALLLNIILIGRELWAEPATPAEILSVPGADLSEAAAAATPSLPDPSAPGFATRYISKANADLYRASVIPEMYEWLRSGVLEMDAAAKLAYQWRYEPKLAEKLSQMDEHELARTSAVWESLGSLKLNFNLLSANPSSAGDLTLSGELLRAYTHTLEPQNKSIQIFRELLHFSKPSLLGELKMLSYRFSGKEEDKLWIRSPAIKLARELTGSNRSDSLLKTSFSLDDFLVWSGKADSVEARFDKSLSALVPFAGIRPSQLRQNNEGCWVVYGASFVGDPGESRMAWNFSGSKYPSAAGWLPTQAVFVPRQLARFELTSSDPFALYGRQVLYIDKESALPVYKIVYDRAGRHWKTVIGIYGLATDRAGALAIPFNYLLIAIDVIRDSAHVMEYSDITYCSRFGETIKAEDLDPRSLSPEQVSPTPPAKQK